MLKMYLVNISIICMTFVIIASCEGGVESQQSFTETTFSPASHNLKYKFIMEDMSQSIGNSLSSKKFSAEGTPVSGVKLQLLWGYNCGSAGCLGPYSRRSSEYWFQIYCNLENTNAVKGSLKIRVESLSGTVYVEESKKVAFQTGYLWEVPRSSFKNLSIEPINDTLIWEVEALIYESHVSVADKTEQFQKIPVCECGSESAEAADLVKMDLKYSKTYLKMGENLIPLPRTILASKSKTFHELFQNATTNESGDLIIPFEDLNGLELEEEVDVECMEYLIQFAYAGVIQPIPEGKEKQLMIVAEYFKLPKLKSHVEKAMGLKVTKENASEMLKLAGEMGAEVLEDFILDFVRKQARVMGKDEWKTSFKTLNANFGRVVKEFCSSDDSVSTTISPELSEPDSDNSED